MSDEAKIREEVRAAGERAIQRAARYFKALDELIADAIAREIEPEDFAERLRWGLENWEPSTD